MTDQLARALLNRETPFNQVTLSYSFEGEERLLEAYRVVQSVLVSHEQQQRLVENEDWHYHDGYRNQGLALAWDDWLTWTKDAKTLRAKWAAEDFVYRAVFPLNHLWLLRFRFWYVPEEIFPVLLDFTGPDDINHDVQTALARIGVVPIEVEDAYTWFNANGYTLDEGKLRY